MEAFSAAFIVVVLAELGDKTQLLAMAFAARYTWQQVMAGVVAATVANHLLAVLAGVYLGSFFESSLIHIAASIAFIIFGLWTFRGDTLDGEDKETGRSPFWTVAIAFFMAEIGDKTQFATITLAAEYQQIITVLMGTTTGMVVADGLGIAAGSLLNKIAPQTIKYVAGTIFVLVGVYGLVEQFM